MGRCVRHAEALVHSCSSREALQLWFFPWRTSVAAPTRIWTPLALKQGLDFSKAPLRGAVFLLPWVRAKKKVAQGRKMGSNPGVQVPEFACLTLCMPASHTPCLARPLSITRDSLRSRQRPLTSPPPANFDNVCSTVHQGGLELPTLSTNLHISCGHQRHSVR